MNSLAGILVVLGIAVGIVGYFMMDGKSGEAVADGAFITFVGVVFVAVGVLILVMNWVWDILQKIF